jgi:hypothetical protein
MKAKVDMSTPQGAVRVGFYSSGVLVGSSVEIGGSVSSTYGFIGSDTSQYQLVAINMSSFGALPSTVNELRIYRSGGGSVADFFLDNITIQETPTVTVNLDSTAESTGLLTGGVLSVDTATTYNISDGTGQIVSEAGVITPVSWAGLTGLTPLIGGSNLITFVAINNVGSVIIQGGAFTPQQSRTLIVLGVVVHVNTTTVDTVNNEQQIAFNPFSSLYDAMEAIGFFNINGNVFSANGANLNLDKSVGDMFKMGSNYDLDINNPHYRTLAALVALTFQYRFSDGSNGVTGTNVDPDNLDDGAGGLTPVGNNQWSIQRIYVFTSNNVKIQRGVAEYPTLDAAIAGIATEAYVTEPSIAANGLLRGWLIVKEGATNLSLLAQAQFLAAPKFGEGNAGATGAIVDLQTAYENSTANPEILTNATNGAVTVRRGSGADSDDIYEGQNGAGTKTFGVTGEGKITFGEWLATVISATKGGTGQTAYTIGDILYASSPTTLVKLPIGSVNQVLTVIGGIPSWQNATGGGGTTYGNRTNLQMLALGGVSQGESCFNTTWGQPYYFDGDVWLTANLVKATNENASAMAEGNPVIQDGTAGGGVNMTSTASSIAIIGVVKDVYNGGAQGEFVTVAIAGEHNVLYAGAVSIGEGAIADNVNGQATATGTGSTGTFGITRGSKGAPSTALILTWIQPTERF